MDGIAGTIATAAGLFAGTNIDDIIVLAVLFLSGRATGTPKPWQVWAGQAAGFTVLVAVSVLAALGLTIIPGMWVGLLGLIPLALGVRGLITAARAHHYGEQVSAAAVTGLVPVMTLTIINGADNLAVYPAVFRTIGTGASLATIVVFAAGVALWCLIGSWLASHKKVIEIIERWGHWIVPTAFVAIGVIILLGSGVLTKIF